ncbi:MAG TPA: winged helix-turn-helix domain-containing protein, partial [Terriglobia bacterium]|nr:winged helix-turn-helix domain-containing protein [Terriglobia bacterium]
GELWKHGVRLPIQGRPVQVLAILLERPGEMVSREELRNRLWPADTFVDFDHSVHNAIARLREALGDSADSPRFIETLPRRGYRFIAPASWLDSRLDQGMPAAQALPEEPKSQARFSARERKILVTSGAAVLALAIAVALVAFHRPEPKATGPQAIGVLPLQNTSAAKELDFLRIGLADDIATTLSYFPALSIRPFATSNRYGGPDVDLQKAAREMRVARIITGHFAVAGEDVVVTLEAIEAVDNRVLWRDTVRGSSTDLPAIQRQIAVRVQRGLIPALGANPGSGAFPIASHNAEAYELYLRAVSEGDPQSTFSARNKEAIRLLERAVALDPGYSSAWVTLGHRYYYDSGLGGGGEPARLRAKAALRRAMALDPGRIDAASDLVNMESEEGDLNQAYDDIVGLLRRRPDSGAVHLVYSYVLWYAGLLNEAANECDKARSLDPGTTDLAACGQVFMALGRYGRAREYFQLASGTEYEKAAEVEILLREGKRDNAFQILKSLPAAWGWQVLQPCLGHTPTAKADIMGAQKWRSSWIAETDPAQKYWLAAWDSMCGHPDLALSELRRAVEHSYCAYPQMETDPLLARMRALPEYSQLRSWGIACQQRFLEHRQNQRVS